MVTWAWAAVPLDLLGLEGSFSCSHAKNSARLYRLCLGPALSETLRSCTSSNESELETQWVINNLHNHDILWTHHTGTLVPFFYRIIKPSRRTFRFLTGSFPSAHERSLSGKRVSGSVITGKPSRCHQRVNAPFELFICIIYYYFCGCLLVNVISNYIKKFFFSI